MSQLLMSSELTNFITIDKIQFSDVSERTLKIVESTLCFYTNSTDTASSYDLFNLLNFVASTFCGVTMFQASI